MTATMSHASRGTFQKVKDRAKDPEFYIKAGALTVFGSMTVLETALALACFIFAMGPIDILLGLLFAGGAFLFGGLFMQALNGW